VDPNPAAADGARRLYGMETITATLEGAAIPGPFDLVLYQFVLEHLADPVAELARAARVVAPSGCLALFVPSMEAVEVEVFGASYRSLRADHLHLFSRRSITRCLGDAGLRVVALDSECNLHLLGGFLTDEELREVYASGRGPDLRVLAERDG
jgi:2-polyprenyl-3-methyl-5-hydroxy-6-metoxy-1,4-benzoquinol methylase